MTALKFSKEGDFQCLKQIKPYLSYLEEQET
jgi:hypothetical protein